MLTITSDREVAFDHGAHRLAGSLRQPVGPGPHPAIVMVHGSGAVDRTGAEGTLTPVIDHLVGSGFAVLAYDKPGIGASTGDWTRQTFGDRAEETVRAVEFLAGQPDIRPDQIGLWGISQGGWIAPLAAVEPMAGVAAIVVVSATAMTPKDQAMWMVEQQMREAGLPDDEVAVGLRIVEFRTEAMAGSATAQDIIAAEAERVSAYPWYPAFVAAPGELDFMRAAWHFDPMPVLRRLTCPVMALWGARDVHMPVRECARLFTEALAEAGNASFRVEVFPEADHRLRRRIDGVPTDFAPGYLRGMTDWLSRCLGDDARPAQP